jgi:YVTN family beta-propeller protein
MRWVYVVNTEIVSAIDTTTSAVIATIIPGSVPFGATVTPDGSKIYITNNGSNNVSVIDTATNAVTATISVGKSPTAFGIFIQPAPRFAGTPGKANCYGLSVSALARQYRGLNGVLFHFAT